MHIPQKHTNSRAHYSVITQYTFNYRGLHILIEGIFPNNDIGLPGKEETQVLGCGASRSGVRSRQLRPGFGSGAPIPQSYDTKGPRLSGMPPQLIMGIPNIASLRSTIKVLRKHMEQL